MEDEFGFKIITSENWNEPDKVSVCYTCPLDYDENSKIPPYLDRILETHLNKSVPIEIRRLFEVARGAMIYSYFFYPLYTLAAEQMARVGETALYHKAKSLGYQKTKPTFLELIEYLKKMDVFDDEN